MKRYNGLSAESRNSVKSNLLQRFEDDAEIANMTKRILV